MVGKSFLRKKKGWIRIVEAFVAIMLILSVFVYIYYQRNQSGFSDRVLTMETQVLNEIAYNDSLRQAVITNSFTDIDNFIKTRIGGNLAYNFTICKPEDACGLANYPSGNKEIYSRETLIFTGDRSNPDSYKESKLKLFVWVR